MQATEKYFITVDMQATEECFITDIPSFIFCIPHCTIFVAIYTLSDKALIYHSKGSFCFFENLRGLVGAKIFLYPTPSALIFKECFQITFLLSIVYTIHIFFVQFRSTFCVTSSNLNLLKLLCIAIVCNPSK